MEFSDRFTELYSDMGEICAYIFALRTAHDDKSASAIKNRITMQLMDEMTRPSFNKAEAMAGASDEYHTFLKERIEAYGDWDGVDHLRDSIKQYIINIGVRLSNTKY